MRGSTKTVERCINFEKEYLQVGYNLEGEEEGEECLGKWTMEENFIHNHFEECILIFHRNGENSVSTSSS